jgi:two-component system, chemotaxis family, protein-glutamate methylesterase/glutaminase
LIRVLVADDSATAREMLVQILGSDPEIRVVGVAHDGLEAVEATSRLRPDLITMDLHMPRLDGLEATREIMITAPTPILIVTGSHRARDIEASIEILACGALDVLLKPPDPRSPEFAQSARRLIAAVKAMASVKVVRRWRPPSKLPATAASAQSVSRGELRVRIVAIATSTGGPAVLLRILSELPGTYPVPILVVQHITPGFTQGLASWLDAASAVRVKVASHHDPLAPGTVYLAPDEFHLGIDRRGNAVALSDQPPIGGFRPSGTYLFESVARVFGPSALALILTGMGDDGVQGLRTIRQAGGQVIAQDEKSSIVFGMPGAAVAAGLAPIVLPIEVIAARLVALAGRD